MGPHGRSIVLSVALLAFHFGCHSARADDIPVITTVCEVVANPTGFDGKIIKLRAESIEGRHTSGLSDQSCHGLIPFWGEREVDAPRSRGQFACAADKPFGSADSRALQWRDSPPKPEPVKLSEDRWWHIFEQALADRHPETANVCGIRS